MRRPSSLILIVIVACMAALAHSASAEVMEVKGIGPQPLGQALDDWARQTGLQVIYGTQLVQGRASKGASAGSTPRDALTQLLDGSGLTVTWLNERTAAVNSAKPADAAQDNAGKRTTSVRTKEEREGSRVAQLTAEPGASSPDTASDSTEKYADGGILKEIVVTGSHIRGAQAAGAKLIVIDKEMIERSGRGRVQDVLETLTQNFGGIGEEAVNRGGNTSRGAEVQLRGLGAGTTLTLINGQRQATGGKYGTFTDISSIAASAVERIEILPEGASAIYGSDAIGGVVNVILRKDFDGLETRVRSGTAGGEGDEVLFSQLWGNSWSRGHALVGYQFNKRDVLPASARAYSAANGDFRRFGGRDFRTEGGNPGTMTFNEQTYALPAGQDGANVTLAQLTAGTANHNDNVTYNVVLPEQEMHSAFLNAAYDITDDWVLSLDSRYATRSFAVSLAQFPLDLDIPASNAFNRMGSEVMVSYDVTRDVGPQRHYGTAETAFGSAGIAGPLAGSWNLRLSGAYAKERNTIHVDNLADSPNDDSVLSSSDPNVALNVFGDGPNTNPATLASLITPRHFENALWVTQSFNAIANGEVLNVPAGAIRLAVGADRRSEELDYAATTEPVPLGRNRDVTAFFAELAVPVWGPNESGANRLELSLAGRYEDYSDSGTTFDPKIGVSFRPWNSVKLRGTWGTSFRAAPFYLSSQFDNPPVASAYAVDDPQSTDPSGTTQIIALLGADPDMHEETADVWTAGFDLSALAGLSLSFTYFNIDYQDKIQSASTSTMLENGPAFAPLITRNPTPEQIDALCNSPSFDSGDCSVPIGAILDGRLRNVAGVTTRGIDAELGYSLETTAGEWQAGLRGTYTFDYDTQLTVTAPAIDILDTLNNPLDLRLVGSLGWQRLGWSADLAVNYTGSYKTNTSATARKIDAWTTADVNLGYRFDAGKGWLSNMRAYLGVLNVLDEEPPFVDARVSAINSAYGYDSANASLLGRQISLQVVKQW